MSAKRSRITKRQRLRIEREDATRLQQSIQADMNIFMVAHAVPVDDTRDESREEQS